MFRSEPLWTLSGGGRQKHSVFPLRLRSKTYALFSLITGSTLDTWWGKNEFPSSNEVAIIINIIWILQVILCLLLAAADSLKEQLIRCTTTCTESWAIYLMTR